MPEIRINVKNKIAEAEKGAEIICDNSDYVAVFCLDEEWEEHNLKTMVVSWGEEKRTIVFTGDTAEIPIITNTARVAIGIFAGNIRTSTSAVVKCRRSARSDGGTPTEPPEDIYNQLIELIESLGGASTEKIAAAVAEYLTKNPIEESDPTVPDWAKKPSKPTYTAAEVGALSDKTVIPTKTSQIENDSGFISEFTESDPTVPAWAKQPQKPTYTAAEVGALSDKTVIPTKTSQIENDSGFISGYTESDPTVPSWAKQPTKPTYTAQEVGALPVGTPIPTVPTKLPNPESLKFTGAVTAEYDGSSEVTVNIPVPEDGTTDHNQLVNRDSADSHPMSAITGLTAALEGKQPRGNYATQDQIPSVAGLATETYVQQYAQPKGNYLPSNTPIAAPPTVNTAASSGSVTLTDNSINTYTALSEALTVTLPTESMTYGAILRVTVATGGSIAGFVNVEYLDGDDYTAATDGETWEFSVFDGSVICKLLTVKQ